MFLVLVPNFGFADFGGPYVSEGQIGHLISRFRLLSGKLLEI